MQRAKTGIVYLIAVILCASPNRACAFGLWFSDKVPDCIRKYCCADYCPKAPPCPQMVHRFCCDDYCPKSPPCAKPLCGFHCPDYCKKGAPCPCGPPSTGLTCGARAGRIEGNTRSCQGVDCGDLVN